MSSDFKPLATIIIQPGQADEDETREYRIAIEGPDGQPLLGPEVYDPDEGLGRFAVALGVGSLHSPMRRLALGAQNLLRSAAAAVGVAEKGLGFDSPVDDLLTGIAEQIEESVSGLERLAEKPKRPAKK